MLSKQVIWNDFEKPLTSSENFIFFFAKVRTVNRLSAKKIQRESDFMPRLPPL